MKQAFLLKTDYKLVRITREHHSDSVTASVFLQDFLDIQLCNTLKNKLDPYLYN